MPTALIFGASRGLGRALAQEHLKRGWQVIATVRDETALADMACDALTIEQSIPSMADMLESRRRSGGVAFVNYANKELPW